MKNIKPKTPKEILENNGGVRKTFSFSLNRERMLKIKAKAATAGIPASDVVDEAISFYLESLKSL